MLNETRERFLQAILARVPAERIAEIHFFPAIRQGPMETGVAVIAALPELAALGAAVTGAEDDRGVVGHLGDVGEPSADARHVVYSASYRLTRKGIDRGKWEIDVTLEADAPLPTVDVVVRGVQERAGEELEPQRLTRDDLEALMAEPTWQLKSV